MNRKARKALGLREEGPLSAYDIARVRVEAGVIKAKAQILRLDPRAVIIRKGNKLSVSVQR